MGQLPWWLGSRIQNHLSAYPSSCAKSNFAILNTIYMILCARTHRSIISPSINATAAKIPRTHRPMMRIYKKNTHTPVHMHILHICVLFRMDPPTHQRQLRTDRTHIPAWWCFRKIHTKPLPLCKRGEIVRDFAWGCVCVRVCVDVDYYNSKM